MATLYHEIEKLVGKAGKVLVVSHRKPDADTLGAAVSLKIWLSGLAKDVTLACVDKPSSLLRFLPHVGDFVDEFAIKDFDLIFIVDSGASYMTDFHLKYDNFYKSGVPIINIDHHASNDNFGTVNFVDVNAASTTLMIYRIFSELKIEITDDIATCLLAGIYSDTGSFMHSNTNREALAAAADLTSKGARFEDIVSYMFRNKKVETLRLWGKVLEKAIVTKGNVVVSTIREVDYDKVGARPEHLTGVIDYLNTVAGTEYAVLLNEDRKGHVKGSFRTRREGIDLSKIAAEFGGGGHSKASGFMLPGHLEEELSYKIVSQDLSKTTLEF